MNMSQNFIDKIRVLYINQTAKVSGGERSLLSFFEKVDKKFLEPMLLLPEDGPFFKEAEKVGVETVILHSLIKFGESHSLFKIPRILKALFEIVKIIKSKRIDIVHSNSPRTGFLGGLSAKIASVSSVIHVRDIHLSPFSNYFKALILDALSDKIIAVSNATKNAVMQKRTKLEFKTKVIYNGIDFEKLDKILTKNIRHELGIGENVPIIGSVGIIHPVKGHDTVIRASAIVRERFPNLKVLITGGYLLEADRLFEMELRNLVKELNLTDCVIFTGFRDDIYDILSIMDVLILASNYPDPLPRILIEASAMRKPIVATKVGGIPEIVEDGISGILIEPSDYKSLAEAVISLLENRPLATEMGLNARKIAESKFSIETHVREIENIYIELIKKKR